MEQRYVEKTQTKKRFAVSMQHYTFAVKAFVEMVKEFEMCIRDRRQVDEASSQSMGKLAGGLGGSLGGLGGGFPF